jgi:hypothetical protein
MKTVSMFLIAAFLFVGAAFAAGIDGKYVSERKMNRNGEEVTITQTFDLKTDGAKLTGTLTMAFGGQEPRNADIKDGKVDGNKFSFSVVMTTPNGEMKTVYEGTLEGDTLKGTAAREGGQPRPFEAKKK